SFPKFVYKIYPKTEEFQIPIPHPLDYTFPQDSLDKNSGFFHMSSQDQLSGTLSLFFDSQETVHLVKIDYDRLSKAETVKWELVEDGSTFPHLYALLDGKYVTDVKVVNRATNWVDTAEKLIKDGWLEY
ncbi:hypothetical protein CPB84DRAFT_1772762, partial [Gymnopilus junonius]